MQHHVGVGMVYGVSKGHGAAALVLVHVKEFAGEGVLHETLEGLHHLGYQLVQCEQYVAVGACMKNQSINPSIHQSINQSTNHSVNQSVHPSINQSSICYLISW